MATQRSYFEGVNQVTEEQYVRILYTNYKGITSWRRIMPKHIYFGSTAWHKTPQWLLVATDIDREEERAFAIKDIQNWFVNGV